jgi:hypothetical protein
MTTFKKFVHAKENINEKGGFSKTMNKNYIIRQELVAVNEYFTASAATKGGEIDTALAATGAAGALIAKALYNGLVYAKLKAELPKYLEEYKQYAAPSSEAVYKAKQDRLIQKLKQQKAVLTGGGGTRANNQDSKTEDSAKDKIHKMYKAKIDAASGDAKANLRAQRDAAVEKIDLQIQKLSKQIEEAENKADVDWDRAQEKWRQTDEAFTKKQDAFSTAGGMLGSAWKNKWTKEFTIAKNNAKVDVLELAKKIATDKKNDDEVAAISKSIERAKAAEQAAEDALKGIEDDADKAERIQADAGQFGVDAFVAAMKDYQDTINQAYEKWDKRFEGVETPGSEPEDNAIDKDKIQAKIDKLNDKLTKIRTLLDKKKDSDDEADKKLVVRAQAAIDKLEADIQAEKEKLPESEADLYSMQIRLNETNIMLNDLAISLGLFEAEESGAPGEGEHATFSQLRTIMNKVISKAPDDQKKNIASECQEDIANIKTALITANGARNKMAQKFSDNAEKEGDNKLNLPKELESFKSYKEVEPDAGIEMLDKYAEELKNDYEAEVKELPKKKKEDETGGGTEGGSNGEEVNTTTPSPTTTDDKEGSKEPDESEPAEGDSEEIKKQKEKIKAMKSEIAELKQGAEDTDSKEKKDILLKSIPNKEKFLDKELEKLKELQNKSTVEVKDSIDPDKIVDDEEESEDLIDTKEKSPVQSVKALPRFMKFEDYLATKKKK